MEITVKGLKHPHRYVLDPAQTHIYMLMKKVRKHGVVSHNRPVLDDRQASRDLWSSPRVFCRTRTDGTRNLRCLRKRWRRPSVLRSTNSGTRRLLTPTFTLYLQRRLASVVFCFNSAAVVVPCISPKKNITGLSFSPPPFPSSETQLGHNAKKRRPSLSPIILRQLEQEQKAKMAANVDITQVMSKLSKQGKEAPPAPRPHAKK